MRHSSYHLAITQEVLLLVVLLQCIILTDILHPQSILMKSMSAVIIPTICFTLTLSMKHRYGYHTTEF